MHGSAAAARNFAKKIGNVSESSVKSIKKCYLEAKRKRNEESEGIMSLPTNKHGHTIQLGSDLDKKLQLYLRKIRTSGGSQN